MSFKDSAKGYSSLSIAFHWFTAIFVIALFLIGESAEDLAKEARQERLGLHISIAMSIYIIFVARIFWRAANTRPQLAPQQHKILDILAHWVPVALLAGIAIMLISGPLMVWSNGYSINIFDVISLPSPMAKNETVHEAFETLHKLGANILFYSFILHIGGVFKHLLIDRDNILSRMIKPGNH